MATYSSSGLTTRTKEQILAQIQAAWATKSALGASFRTSPDSPQSQIAEVVAEAIAEVEEALAGIVSAYSRSTATGQFLDDAGERVGVPRQEPTKSVVTASVTLAAGATFTAGLQASKSDGTQVYEALSGFDNSGGGVTTVSVTFQAVTAGSATFVSTGQLDTIATPSAGWTSVVNGASATAGQDLETDADYRIRIANSLAGAGSGTVDAIRSAINAVDDVTIATVVSNRTSVTDSLGVPPHSLRATVLGGDADEIAQAIWDNLPAGIQGTGGTSGTAIDANGTSQTVAFSRPTEKTVFLDFTLTTGPTYPGDAVFKTQLVAAAESFFGVGDDVIRARLIDFAMGVTGVQDVTLLELDFTSSPSGTSNLAIAVTEIATFATSRVTIV